MSTRGFAGFVVDDVEKIFISHGDSYPSGLGTDVLRWVTDNRDGLVRPVPGGVPDRIRALRVVRDLPHPTLADAERLRAVLCEVAAEESMRAHYLASTPEQVLASADHHLDTLVRAGLVADLTIADVERIRTLLIDRAERESNRSAYQQMGPEELLEVATGDLDALLDAGIVLDGSNDPADSLICEWGYLIDLDRAVFEVYRGFQTSPPTAGRFTQRTPVDPRYHPVALHASWPLTDLPDWSGFMAMPDAY